MLACRFAQCLCEVFSTTRGSHLQMNTNGPRRKLCCLQRGRIQARIPQHGNTAEFRNELLEQLEALAVQFWKIEKQPRDVLARSGQACSEALRHWIGFQINRND